MSMRDYLEFHMETRMPDIEIALRCGALVSVFLSLITDASTDPEIAGLMALLTLALLITEMIVHRRRYRAWLHERDNE